MNKFYKSIKALEESVFDYNLIDISKNFLEIINELEKIVPQISQEQQVSFNNVLNVILGSYQRKDYLLVIDLIEYELMTLDGVAQYMER